MGRFDDPYAKDRPWSIPGPGDAHPNAPTDEYPAQGAAKRWEWVTPPEVAVLNAKTRNGLHAVRLTGTDSPEAQAFLDSFIPPERPGVELTGDLRSDGKDVGVFVDDECVGFLPPDQAGIFAPLVAEAADAGMALVTWVEVMVPELGLSEGAGEAEEELIVEVRLPSREAGEDLFAPSYDASFMFF